MTMVSNSVKGSHVVFFVPCYSHSSHHVLAPDVQGERGGESVLGSACRYRLRCTEIVFADAGENEVNLNGGGTDSTGVLR